MNDDHREMLEDVFLEIGIREGQELLDFGCGSGYYTIPAAGIVGREGTVYAVEKDGSKLDELRKETINSGLSNVKTVNSSGGTDLPFPAEFLDVVLLYDVFSYYGPDSEELSDLLNESSRVLKSEGFLSVFPKHVDIGELKKKISRADFDFRDRYSGTLLHYGNPEKGYIFNYKKR